MIEVYQNIADGINTVNAQASCCLPSVECTFVTFPGCCLIQDDGTSRFITQLYNSTWCHNGIVQATFTDGWGYDLSNAICPICLRMPDGNCHQITFIGCCNDDSDECYYFAWDGGSCWQYWDGTCSWTVAGQVPVAAINGECVLTSPATCNTNACCLYANILMCNGALNHLSGASTSYKDCIAWCTCLCYYSPYTCCCLPLSCDTFANACPTSIVKHTIWVTAPNAFCWDIRVNPYLKSNKIFCYSGSTFATCPSINCGRIEFVTLACDICCDCVCMYMCGSCIIGCICTGARIAYEREIL